YVSTSSAEAVLSYTARITTDSRPEAFSFAASAFSASLDARPARLYADENCSKTVLTRSAARLTGPSPFTHRGTRIPGAACPTFGLACGEDSSRRGRIRRTLPAPTGTDRRQSLV